MEFPKLPAPPTPRTRPPTVAPLEARRGAANRLESITGKVHSIQGWFTLKGSGEALLDVSFPVWFLERPLFTFGAEMAADQVLTVGSYPTISVIVHRWAMKDFPGGVSYWKGATLIAVSGGSDEQALLVHWQVQGKALRNPSGQTLTADGTI